MRVLTGCVVLSMFGWLAGPSAVLAETKVELTGVHLCCGACIKAIDAATADLEGAKVTADQASGTVSITASDKRSARRAIRAIARAGWHGKSSDPSLAMPDDSGAPEGKVTRLTVSGAHNCCGLCAKALKEVVGGVDGVQGDTVAAKSTSFVVEGNFEAAALVKALNDAGFHVKVSTQ